MSNFLSSENFGLKLYNKFPIKYREDDADVDFALKRFLEALSDGGFKYSIEEINGIADIIDPNRTPTDILPTLFEQFGLEVFNGIPENYLRYLLPRLGEAWSKKGSLNVLEYVTSSLTNIKNSTIIVYDENHNPTVEITLKMDEAKGDYYFPEADTGKFNRILNNFVPFYCDLVLIYSSLFEEVEDKISGSEDEDFYFIVDHKNEESSMKAEIMDSSFIKSRSNDIINLYLQPSDSFTNSMLSTLSGSFCTNSLTAYDIIRRKDGSIEIVC